MKRTCPKCKEIFVTNNSRRKFCQKCGKNYRPRPSSNYTPRPFTDDTPFLCFKWHLEGENIGTIAALLRRPKSQIKEAIAQYKQSI